jgi:Holliday junction resolvasome RuvABC endonuclease subunit
MPRITKPTPIIAIDPGTNCGWAAISEHGDIMASGVFRLTPKRHESSGMRFIKFRSSLQSLIQSVKPGIIAYEEVRRHAGTDAAHIYGGIIGILTTVAIDLRIEYHGIPVATIKRHATGKGNASKEAMIAAANRHWPDANITDDNEADARWIADAAYKSLFEESNG